jgi:hypothetical protein
MKRVRDRYVIRVQSSIEGDYSYEFDYCFDY